MLIISGIAMGGSWIFLYEAYQQIGVSIASLSYYCGPVIVMALTPVLFKENLTLIKITGLENSTLQLTISCLSVALFVLFKQGLMIHVPAGSLVPLAILGLLNTGIGCYLYFSSIGSLSVQTVAVCGYLEPLSAILFSILILKEAMLPLQIIGAVCIVAGSILSESILIRK